MFRDFLIVILASATILCFSGSTRGTPRFNVNSSLIDQQPQQPIDQTFNINNWGLANEDRKILLEMKYKIDYLYEKSKLTSEVCPPDPGWIRYRKFSYLIIDIPTLKWNDSRRTCQMLGGDLAIIKSAAENNFIFNLVKKQITMTAWGVWLGFVRKADNKFYWIDDTPLAKGYRVWGRGEPNNVAEKCGNMFGAESRAGKWNDLLCNVNPAHLKKAPVILCKKKTN